MGNVSSKDIEYRAFTLGDVKVIELLLSLRYKYDENMFLGDGEVDMAVSGAARLNEEVISTYVSLDRYIKECEFSAQQLKILNMIGEGYTYGEIAKEVGIKQSTVAGRLQTMYGRILKENEWYWKASFYKNHLELKNKICSKCKKEWPATEEFYSDKRDTRDGFHPYCRKCKT